MNDVERWADHEGPEPAGIERLMDAARDGRRRTPEEVADMRRSFQDALAARRRKEARARTAKRAAAAMGLLAAAAMVTLALHWMAQRGAPMADVDDPPSRATSTSSGPAPSAPPKRSPAPSTPPRR